MKVLIPLVMFTIFVYFLSGDIKRESRFQGYQLGCKDVMTGLYKRAGIKDIDQESLNSFCQNKAKEYFRAK